MTASAAFLLHKPLRMNVLVLLSLLFFIPLLFWLVERGGKRARARVIAVLAGVAGISFLLANWRIFSGEAPAAFFLLPSRADLGRWIRFAAEQGIRIDGASDHLVSEALYLSDPDGNGIEIYADKPHEGWKWSGSQVEMATVRPNNRTRRSRTGTAASLYFAYAMVVCKSDLSSPFALLIPSARLSSHSSRTCCALALRHTPCGSPGRSSTYTSD